MARLLGVLLSVAALTGLGASAHAAEVERDAKGVRFEGQIDAVSVDLAFDLLRVGDTLLVDSGGGDPEAALKLARLIRERRVRLVVNGHCLEICATYLFLTAPEKSASLGFSVQYGASPLLVERAARANADRFTDGELERLSRHAQDYRKALAAAGVPVKLAECIDAALEASPELLRRGVILPDSLLSSDVIIPRRFDRVVLSRETLAGFGQQAGGDFDWAPDLDRRQSVASSYGVTLAWIDRPSACGAGASPADSAI